MAQGGRIRGRVGGLEAEALEHGGNAAAVVVARHRVGATRRPNEGSSGRSSKH
jgi:hypothetical protein